MSFFMGSFRMSSCESRHSPNFSRLAHSPPLTSFGGSTILIRPFSMCLIRSNCILLGPSAGLGLGWNPVYPCEGATEHVVLCVFR